MSSSLIPQIIKFIEQQKLKKYIANKKYVQIDFNGGEALLNKKFIINFIQASQNLGYQYSITTNGLLINQEIIDLINKYKITLQLSLDGKKETHDLNRRFYNNEGSFDLVYSKLKELQHKCFKNCFNISTVITPSTVKNLAEKYQFFYKKWFL